METVESLEASINALIEAAKKLRKERDRAFIDAEQARKKLLDTKETIRELRLNLENTGKKNFNKPELEKRKKEIINHIQSIISKLEQFSNIGSFTNDQA